MIGETRERIERYIRDLVGSVQTRRVLLIHVILGIDDHTCGRQDASCNYVGHNYQQPNTDRSPDYVSASHVVSTEVRN